jgi:hypothetical protein
MRYEDFSTNLLRIGEGKGIPAATRYAATEKAVSSLVSVSLTPAAVATITSAAQTVTGIPGVEATDLVFCVRSANTTAAALTSVQANGANSISMTFTNPTAGSVTPTAGTYTFLILKTQ